MIQEEGCVCVIIFGVFLPSILSSGSILELDFWLKKIKLWKCSQFKPENFILILKLIQNVNMPVL